MITIRTDYETLIPLLHRQNRVPEQSELEDTLAAIKHAVKQGGDAALIRYTRQFDRISAEDFALVVSAAEVKQAYDTIPVDLIDALKKAYDNIKRYHEFQYPQNWEKTRDGVTYGVRYTPIDSVGLYVPGGRAVYPSTVLMNAVPALIAGVNRVTITTPPRPDGTVHPSILVAADICGVRHIIKTGGAQAVFALAYGTESVPKTDKIVGPGNMYVTKAKQMVYGETDIDKPAGPSEVLVYVRERRYAAFAAAELLAQMEHDPDAVVVGVSEDELVLKAIQDELRRQVSLCSRKAIIEQAAVHSALFLSPSEETSVDIINRYAPEHLVLLLDDYRPVLDKVRHAGSIFCGPHTPVTLGDYFAGPNHVLPTSGTARFASPLGVMDFMKYSSYLVYDKTRLESAAPYVKVLTEAEGLDAHFHAVNIRIDGASVAPSDWQSQSEPPPHAT